MSSAVSEWLNGLQNSKKIQFRFINRVLRAAESGKCPSINIKDFYQIQQKRVDCENYLYDLGNLYREVYADICMLYLLPIREAEYAESLIADLNTNSEDDRNLPYEWFAIRIYVSLKASERRIPFRAIRDLSETMYRKIKEIAQLIESETESFNQELPVTSICYLLSYMKGCFQSLKALPEAGTKSKIEKMFRNVVSERMNYVEFLTVIDEYRRKILEETSP